jgi:hypothetical protein
MKFDEIVSKFELLAERLSSLISQEPYKIKKLTSISVSDSLSSEFIFLKVITLEFRCNNQYFI